MEVAESKMIAMKETFTQTVFCMPAGASLVPGAAGWAASHHPSHQSQRETERSAACFSRVVHRACRRADSLSHWKLREYDSYSVLLSHVEV